MSSVALRFKEHDVPRQAALISAEWRGVLNKLRVLALECRVAARTDLFEACALISNKQNTAQDAFAQALLKCLREAVSIRLGQAPF